MSNIEYLNERIECLKKEIEYLELRIKSKTLEQQLTAITIEAASKKESD